MTFRPIHVAPFALVFWLSCDESLPPRQDPTDVFRLTVWPYYAYTPADNAVVIHLVMVNNFDETLSGDAGIEGPWVVTSARDTAVHKTIHATLTDIIHADYNPYRGVLTVDPGDSVVLETSWDFTDDRGQSLTTGFFRYKPDSTCYQRWVAEREVFTIAGRLKLSRNLGYSALQTSIAFRHYSVFVPPNVCQDTLPPQVPRLHHGQ